MKFTKYINQEGKLILRKCSFQLLSRLPFFKTFLIPEYDLLLSVFHSKRNDSNIFNSCHLDIKVISLLLARYGSGMIHYKKYSLIILSNERRSSQIDVSRRISCCQQYRTQRWRRVGYKIFKYYYPFLH